MTHEQGPDSAEHEPRRVLNREGYVKAAGSTNPAVHKSWRILQEIIADKFGYQQGSKKHPNGARLQDIPLEAGRLPEPVEMQWYDRAADNFEPQLFYNPKQVDDLYADSLQRFVDTLDEALEKYGKNGVDHVVPVMGIGISDRVIGIWRTVLGSLPPTA